MTVDSSNQRIARLTPLGAVLALIECRIAAVPPKTIRAATAHRLTLAQDVAASPQPAQAIALRDGFAVDVGAIGDAGPYTPVPLTLSARRIDAGDPMPDGTDAILPLDAVALRGKSAEAIATVSPGEGVLLAGDDAVPQTPLRRAGQRMRVVDVGAIQAAGVEAVAVCEPSIGVALGGVGGTAVINAALGVLVHLIFAAGGRVPESPAMLDAALADEKADAIFAVGGTGSGRRDGAVQELARLGQVEAHGIAICPGESAAFGFVGKRPVLLMPGRIDAVLAVWLWLGRHIVAKLAGGKVEDMPAMLPLRRKVTSSIGMTELIPVRCEAGMAEPLGSGYLSLTALSGSDGWIVVPPESEGFAAGSQVAVNPWP
ncbi:MAG TPA: molybdopterin-binding protein [Xanthobacteraceae bacterium]|jgi:molybdopterin biosynthesis enzyme|nr:molybdopterin-binding protein [Xanthobacteraceae bacterium]